LGSAAENLRGALDFRLVHCRLYYHGNVFFSCFFFNRLMVITLATSVADPDHFDANPDPDPTSEKNRMRIRIRILDPDADPIMLYIEFCNKIFLLENGL
jgi:hypothetical protein